MKSTNANVYGPTSKAQGLSINRLCLISIAAQSISVGAVVALIVFLFSSDLASSQAQETQHTATQLKQQVVNFIDHYTQTAKQIATQKTVLAYYQAGKTSALDKLADIMDQNDPNILKIRFRQLNDTKPDKSAEPHLGYAGLEMLRMVAEKQPVVAEIHSPNAKNEQLAIVQRIENQNKTVGLLHMSIAVTALDNMMSDIGLENGLIRIQQVIDAQNIIDIASAGTVSLFKPIPDATLSIKGSQLQVVYWIGSASSTLFSSVILKYWISILILIGVTGFIQTLMFRRTENVLREEQVTILTLFNDFIHGEFSPPYHAKLADFRGTIAALEKGAREAKLVTQSKQSRAAPLAQAEGLEVDESDVPMDEAAMRSADQELDDLLLNPFKDDDGLDIAEEAHASTPATNTKISDDIFLAYDIRGVVGQTLNPDVAYMLGLGIGSEALDQGERTLIVGRDGRLTSPDLASALIKGIQACGCDVIDIGLVPTPILYFATHVLDTQSGVMVTGSHNPPDYNGFKITLQGEPLSGERIQALKDRIRKGDVQSGQGQRHEQALGPEYISQIMEDVHLGRPMKVVLDCGHGAGAETAPMMLKTLGVDLIELNCEIDGRFPSHHPDPSQPENMVELQDKVKSEQADLGIALDGDADRIGVVDSQGNIIWPDRLMMLYAMDILTRQPGADVIYDVKCSRNLAKEIVKFGGRPIMWKTGHSMIKAKIKETSAALGGDFTGHIFINERWYGFDDGIYAACRLLEILSADFRSSEEIFSDFPDSLSTPELTIQTKPGENHKIMAQLGAQASFPGGKITDLDGLRVDFEDGWGLLRASNTMPCLVVRFEGNSEQSIEKMYTLFNQVLQSAAPHLNIPKPQLKGQTPTQDKNVEYDADVGLTFE